MTTKDDAGFEDFDREHDNVNGASDDVPPETGEPKRPSALIARIKSPPAGCFTKPAPRRSFLVEQVKQYEGDNGRKSEEIRGVIGRGQVHILAGEGGAGKGRWVMSIATALAAGDAHTDAVEGEPGSLGSRGGMDNVCGLRVNGIREHERVFLLLGEDDDIDFLQRSEGAAEALAILKSDSRETRFRQRIQYLSAHGLVLSILEPTKRGEGGGDITREFQELTTWLRDNGPWGLIAIDPFARFAGADDNDTAMMHRAYVAIEELLTVNGQGAERPAVVVVEHTRKPDGHAGKETPTQHWIRGAAAKVNSARVAMLMVPGGDQVTVDDQGRVATEEGFDAAKALPINEGEVSWHLVKGNGEKKADKIVLSFTRRGGITAETETAKRERRKRQWMAEEKRGGRKKKDQAEPSSSAPPFIGRRKKRSDDEPDDVTPYVGAGEDA